MKVLIITKSFVREVGEFIAHLTKTIAPIEVTVIVPQNTTMTPDVPATILSRHLWFSWHIRAACFSPRVLQDIRRIQPDILHIFEEISGMIAFQSVLFRNFSGLKSRMFVYSAENIPGNVHPLFRVSMRYVMRHVEQAFVCSCGVKDTLRQEGFQKPISVIPLGVDTDKFRKFPVDTLRIQLRLDGKFVIGYCGRIVESKGVLLLVELLSFLPEHVHLLVVGAGDAEPQLRVLTKKANIAHRVHFVGQIEYEKLPAYLNCMNIGIVPSQTTPRWKEQFGRSIIELMSCEVPVIGSDSGSIPEVIGEAGFIFPEHELQACLSQINVLLGSSQERERRGVAGRKRVLELYSVGKMSECFIEMYHQTL